LLTQITMSLGSNMITKKRVKYSCRNILGGATIVKVEVLTRTYRGILLVWL
jgi:hypothetical protein